MRTNFHFRPLMLLGGFVCLLVLISVYVIEYGFSAEPCPLCLLQRYALWLVCALFFIAGWQAPKTSLPRYAYIGSTFLTSVLGLSLALRHMWIQHLPSDSVPNCVADLARLLKFQSVLEVISTFLTGGGGCHGDRFTILGLSLADAAAILFFGLSCFSIVLACLQAKRRLD